MWYQLNAALIGVWLMAAPEILGFPRPAATSAWITGPIIASLATVAMWGATRGVRWANVPVAGWLVVAPMVVDHAGVPAANSVACGAAIGFLSVMRGEVRHRFGGGWWSLVEEERKGTAKECGPCVTPKRY